LTRFLINPDVQIESKTTKIEKAAKVNKKKEKNATDEVIAY
jgi:hypothetical protein